MFLGALPRAGSVVRETSGSVFRPGAESSIYGLTDTPHIVGDFEVLTARSDQTQSSWVIAQGRVVTHLTAYAAWTLRTITVEIFHVKRAVQVLAHLGLFPILWAALPYPC